MNVWTTMLAVALACGSAWAQKTGLGDAAVAGIIKTANDVEIDAARTAAQKSGSQDVRNFAMRMLSDHRKNNDELAATLKSLNMQATDGDFSRSLRREAQAQKARLMPKTGASFESAYLRGQISAHRSVLEALDKALSAPEPRDQKFKSLLKRTRDAVADHLKHAEQLQSSSGAQPAAH